MSPEGVLSKASQEHGWKKRMSKNIVICCDGTANEFTAHNTNVLKLFYTLDQDAQQQVTYYHPGLGTMEPSGALTPISRKITKGLGMALGYGLADDITRAYSFLMEEYSEGDRLFLFGFSRGAYTVRAVCSLLHMYGLIRPLNESLVPYAIRMMMAIDRARAGNKKEDGAKRQYFELANSFKKTISHSSCNPWFVGVWDTVSSIGWIGNPLKLPFVANNPDIETGRHAVAIDERRAFFRNHLWKLPDIPGTHDGPKDLKQVWFAGVHSDVGGGYSESESALSKVPLNWMMQEAKASGLRVDATRESEVLGRSAGNNYVAPDPNGMAHESLTGLWNLAEFIPKQHYDWTMEKTAYRMNLYRRRTIPPHSLVHDSVFARSGNYSKRVPPDAIPVSTRG
jgi:uncharacterized protein (DUF2235 family)